jgi:hypothetical protein
MSFVDLRLLSVGALLGIGAAVAFASGMPVVGGLAALFALMAVHKAVRSYRKRPWGVAMDAGEKAAWGTRLVFEPTCLHAACGGPVVEYVNNRPTPSVRPFTATPVDPALPDVYTQGKAGCRRCRQEYMFTAMHGSLSLRTFDQSMRGTFEPVNT